MSKAILFFGSAGIVLLSASAWIQRDANRRLTQELTLLRAEVRTATAVNRDRAAARDVHVVAADPSERKANGVDELSALRKEVASLRQSAQDLALLVRGARPSVASPIAATSGSAAMPAKSWKNAGKTTPEATVETVMWSALGGDVEVLAGTIGFTSSARTKADAWFAGLSAQVREQYGSPEKVIALMIAKDAATLNSIEVLEQRELNPNEVGVRVRVANDQGETKDQTYLMSRGTDGWRMTLPDKVVEKFARQLSASR